MGRLLQGSRKSVPEKAGWGNKLLRKRLRALVFSCTCPLLCPGWLVPVCRVLFLLRHRVTPLGAKKLWGQIRKKETPGVRGVGN